MRQRISVLSSIVLGALALGVGSLAACGGGDDDDGSPGAPTGGPGGAGGAGGVSGNGAGGGAGGAADPKYPPSNCQRTGEEVKLTEGADVHTLTLLWDTDHYVVAYTDKTQGAGDVFTLRLDPNGAPQGAPVAVASTPGFSKAPSLAKLASGGYLLAFEEGSNPSQVLTVVLDANGAPAGAPANVAASPGVEARPVVAVGPQGPVLTWMEGDYPTTTSYVARLDPATGALLTESKKTLGDAGAGFPFIAGDANGLGVVFSQPAGATATIDFGLLDGSLALTGRQSLRAPTGDARLGRVARRGGGFLAAWEDFRQADEQVFMAIVDQGGNKSADVLVENPGTGTANWPNIASKGDGSASAVVYYQFREQEGRSRPQVFLAFVDSSGAKVGGDLQVSTAPPTAQAKYPEVQWSGSNFGVAWVDTRTGSAQAFFASVTCP